MDVESVEDIYDDIKKSMKMIITQTNDILKHSHSAFKKTKEKMVDLEHQELKPVDSVKQWFLENNQTSFTIPEFFELLFKNPNNKLNHDTKMIELCEKDSKMLQLEHGKPMSIYEIFEQLPNYFQ